MRTPKYKESLSTHEMNCFKCRKDFFVEIDYNLYDIPNDKLVEIGIPCINCGTGLNLTLFGLKPVNVDMLN
jgi:hypothetical protein